jgi:hypothetical protein
MSRWPKNRSTPMTQIKLSDAQTVILSAACARPDGMVFPLTASLKCGAVGNVCKSLLKHGLVEEVAATDSNTVWRHDEDRGPITLRATPRAFQALGIADDPERQPASQSATEPASSCRRLPQSSACVRWNRNSHVVWAAVAPARSLRGGDGTAPPARQEPAFGNVNALVASGGPRLLARARELVVTNGYAADPCEAYAAHLVADGIKPSSLIEDAKVRDRVQKRWFSWTDEADADGLRFLRVAGDGRAVVVRGRRMLRPAAPAFSCLTPARMRASSLTEASVPWHGRTPFWVIVAGLE